MSLQKENKPEPEKDEMTMRDKFAMAAMQGFASSLRSSAYTYRRDDFDACADAAYLFADAMLSARNGASGET